MARGRIRSLGAVVSALAVGTMLGAIQWLPTWELSAGSLRARPTYEFLTQLSSALSPWLFRKPRLHRGVVRRDRAGVRVSAGAHSAASPSRIGRHVLALGNYTPAYRWFAALPVVGLLCVPARYSFLLTVAGAVSAAIAFDDLRRSDLSPAERQRGTWIWVVPAPSALVTAAALALSGPPFEGLAALADARHRADRTRDSGRVLDHRGRAHAPAARGRGELPSRLARGRRWRARARTGTLWAWCSRRAHAAWSSSSRRTTTPGRARSRSRVWVSWRPWRSTAGAARDARAPR
ncbi:MAG: hypothetical protein E6J87_11180 [Deltaproteobacteria bacterium]|nr:MAG: hypothetical protein E6J87_11180 [Deltaproteobacteria bacterium]